MKKIKKIKHRVAALAISFFLTLGLTAPAFNFTVKAEALEVANSACTVADMIFSYCASGGVAIMNENVIDDVYNVLGTQFGTLQTFVDNGLLTYSNGQYVDTGLSTSISGVLENISSIDIGSLFAQTAQQNPAGVALTGAGSLAGIAGSVATVGTLPVVAGVAVSGYCGFQIGTLIANMLDLYNKPLGSGAEINTPHYVLQKINVGDSFSQAYAYGSGMNYYGMCYYYKASPGVSFAVLEGSRVNIGVYNPTDQQIKCTNIILATNTGYTEYQNTYCNAKGTQYSTYGNTASLIHADNVFNSWDSFNSIKTMWDNGTATPNKPKSPDVIGNNGNVSGNVENGRYVFPDVSSQVNPETQSIDPSKITKQGWKDYAASVRLNNLTDPENNASIFSDILSKILINEPSINPEPEPDPNPDPNPNPDPETVPLPDVNPYPDTYPVADPETVPDNRPQPEYTEKTTENETDIIEGDPYTTPDLLNKFPFCIPRDILKVFKKLDSGARQAPHIQWRFNPNNMIDYTFDIDFSTWDNVATLLRILELLAFVIALGIATRNLILS